MVAPKKNVFFKLGILDLVVFYQDVLPDGFDSVRFFKLRELSEIHFTKGATTKKHCELEVFQGDVSFFGVSGADEDRCADVVV